MRGPGQMRSQTWPCQTICCGEAVTKHLVLKCSLAQTDLASVHRQGKTVTSTIGGFRHIVVLAENQSPAPSQGLSAQACCPSVYFAVLYAPYSWHSAFACHMSQPQRFSPESCVARSCKARNIERSVRSRQPRQHTVCEATCECDLQVLWLPQDPDKPVHTVC